MTAPAQSPPREPTNTGHGHVWARPDGVRARCGGPRMCAVCAKDYAAYHDAAPPAHAAPAQTEQDCPGIESQYAAPAEPRCEITKNPCGTDTWAAGIPCRCAPCCAYVAARDAAPAPLDLDAAQRRSATLVGKGVPVAAPAPDAFAEPLEQEPLGPEFTKVLHDNYRGLIARDAAPAPDADQLVRDLGDEADLCRNEGADDIATLLDDARKRIVWKAREIALLRAALAAVPAAPAATSWAEKSWQEWMPADAPPAPAAPAEPSTDFVPCAKCPLLGLSGESPTPAASAPDADGMRTGPARDADGLRVELGKFVADRTKHWASRGMVERALALIAAQAREIAAANARAADWERACHDECVDRGRQVDMLIDRAERAERDLDAARAAIAAADAEAARYRWLREYTVHTGLSRWMGNHQFLDDAIDAALAVIPASTPERNKPCL